MNLKRIILFLLFSVFITIILNPITTKADVTYDKIDTNKLDEIINAEMKSLKIPGCSIAIVTGDKIIYSKGYGVDGKGKPVTQQTQFIIGSVTKSFTGLAISQLIDEGKIDLKSPVQKYLPWFTLADSEAAKRITIEELLIHTSGFSTYDGNIILLKDNTTIEQLVRNLKDTKLSPPSKVKYQYSNINYVILGEVIQVVSGMSYEKYIEENIFKPLDMKHSYTSITEAYKNGLTNGYNSFFGFMLPRKTPSHKASVSAGNLVSTTEDMCHYLIAEMNDGNYNNKNIISKEGMDRTHKRLDYDYDYGMGWGIGSNFLAHDGAVENFRAHVSMDLYKKIGVVMLFNSYDIITPMLSKGDVYSDMESLVLRIIFKGNVGSPTTPDYSKTRSLFDIIGIVILLLLLVSIILMFRWKKKLNHNKFCKFSKVFTIISSIIVNILIPLAVTLFIYSNRLILLLAPDIGLLGILIPTILYGIGILKIIFLVLHIKNKKVSKNSIHNL